MRGDDRAECNSAAGALDAVQQLESALEERTDARGIAEAGMDAARAEAERLLADARRTGTEAGRRRRAEILAEAEAEARRSGPTARPRCRSFASASRPVTTS